MAILEPSLYSAKCIKKNEKPVLTKDDVPYPADCIYNAGIAKYNGKYVMVFRDDYDRNEENFYDSNVQIALGVAFSEDGVNWKVQPKPLFDSKNLDQNSEFIRIYDPRITIIENKPYLCLAIDTHHGVCGAIASVSESFDSMELISVSTPDNRNMVLFPEKINGMYVRLERPFPVYSRGGKDRFDIWCSYSPDLKFWGESKLVLAVEDVPFCNDKIGPAAPPVKTEKGWLTLFHSVDRDEARGKNGWEHKWTKRYCAGIMLLDLEKPENVIAMSKKPLIAPELPHETESGMRQQVIFPGGMILEEDGSVKIYYGASDTVECLATSTKSELISLCTDKRK